MAVSQDTVRTTYPGTDQLWLKTFDDNKKVSEIIYYTSGKEWMSADYSDNKSENWKWYYENGNPYFEATIIDDKIEGIYRIWYENGQLAEEITFLHNLENGADKYYHSNGQIDKYGKYEQGKMVGEWYFFNEKGEKASGTWKWNFGALPNDVRMEGILSDGKRVGKWTYRTTARGREYRLFVNQF